MQINMPISSLNLPYTIQRIQRRFDEGLDLLANYRSEKNFHASISQKIAKNTEIFKSLRGNFLNNPQKWIHDKVQHLEYTISQREKNQICPFDNASLRSLQNALLKTICFAKNIYQQKRSTEALEASSSNNSSMFILDREKEEFKKFSSFVNEKIILPIYADIYWSLCSPYTVQEDPTPLEIELIKSLGSKKATSCFEISRQLFERNNLWLKNNQSPFRDSFYPKERMYRWISRELVEDILKDQYPKLSRTDTDFDFGENFFDP